MGSWAAFAERDIPDDKRALHCEVRYTSKEEIDTAFKQKRSVKYFSADKAYQVIKPLRSGKALAKVQRPDLPFSYEAIFSGGVLNVRAACPGMGTEFFASETRGSESFTKANCGEGNLTVSAILHDPAKRPPDYDPLVNPYLAVVGVYCEVK